MIYQLVVPGPIEDVEEIRVLEWHAGEGRAFASGELLVELETHKAIVEVRATRDGVLRRIVCPAGDWQKIGKALALLSDADGEGLPDDVGPGIETLPVEFEIL